MEFGENKETFAVCRNVPTCKARRHGLTSPEFIAVAVAQPECTGGASSYGAMHHNTVHKNWKVCLRAESTASNNAAARLAVETLSPKTKEFLDSTPAFPRV